MGGSEYVAGSHFALMTALVFAMVRMHRLSVDWHSGLVAGDEPRGLPMAAVMTLCALLIERTFYFFARTLRETVDLWSAHPAPELLSAIVGLFVLRESHATLRRRGFSKMRVAAIACRDIAGMALAWVVGVTISGAI